MAVVSFLFFIVLVTFVEADIKFDWIDHYNGQSAVPVDSRSAIEAKVKLAASKYVEDRYAELGPYDFANSNKDFMVSFNSDSETSPEMFEYFPGSRESDLIICNPVLAKALLQDPRLTELEVAMLHEFGHAYYYAKTDSQIGLSHNGARSTLQDRVKYLKYKHDKGLKKRIHQILMDAESNCQRKSRQYVEEIRERLTPDEYKMFLAKPWRDK